MHYLILSVLCVVLTACSKTDANYFRVHPYALEHALALCPQKKPKQISCQDLEEIAKSVNQLAYQLQINPQGFGHRLLQAQEKLATYQAALEKDPKNEQLQTQTKEEAQMIAEHLAVVKWLESPEK